MQPELSSTLISIEKFTLSKIWVTFFTNVNQTLNLLEKRDVIYPQVFFCPY